MKLCECGCGNEVSSNCVRFVLGHHNRSKEVKEKKRLTSLKNYGVDNPFQSSEVRDKYKKTMIDMYGKDHNFKVDSIKEKRKHTWIDIYGVDNPNKSEVIKQKKIKTNHQNRGVDNPSQSESVKELKRATSKLNFNTDHPMKNDRIKHLVIGTCKNNYGVDYPLQSETIRFRVKKTCQKKYGVDNPSQTYEARLRSRKMLIERIENETGSIINPMRGKGEKGCFDVLEQHIEYSIQRDVSMMGYFPDGYIDELKLVIEFDEPEHKRSWYQKHDRKRDLDFLRNGYKTYRIKQTDWDTNQEISIIEFQIFCEAESLSKNVSRIGTH